MSEPLRILHCLRAPVGGLFRHVLDLAGEQAARGHHVGIIADATSCDALTDQRFKSIAPHLTLGLHRIAMRRTPGLGDFAAAFTTARIARRSQANVLHGHGAKGGAFARLAAAILRPINGGLRCYYTPHGGTLHFDPRSVEGRIYLALEKALGKVTDGVIFESAYSQRIYEERVGLAGIASRVIPNGLGPEDFRVPAPEATAADFVFVGELRYLKGVDVLLKALALIGRERAVRAVIVGAGPDAETFVTMAESLGLAESVTFTGALPARDAFCLGRALVVPSRAESFPYIVLEAGAACLPVIATRVGGIPEIVEGTDTPLVAPDDTGALATAMLAHLDNPDAAKSRAGSLKTVIGRKFTINAMASAVLAFQSAPVLAPRRAQELTQS